MRPCDRSGRISGPVPEPGLTSLPATDRLGRRYGASWPVSKQRLSPRTHSAFSREAGVWQRPDTQDARGMRELRRQCTTVRGRETQLALGIRADAGREGQAARSCPSRQPMTKYRSACGPCKRRIRLDIALRVWYTCWAIPHGGMHDRPGLSRGHRAPGGYDADNRPYQGTSHVHTPRGG